ncbi:MAG: hypothetical protein WAX79_06475, partial [Candidatus Omnitrophota bacterium]
EESDYAESLNNYFMIIESVLDRGEEFFLKIAKSYQFKKYSKAISINILPQRKSLVAVIKYTQNQLRFFGRTLRIKPEITGKNAQYCFKFQLKGQNDEMFLEEAGIMANDPRMRKIFSKVKVFDVPLAECARLKPLLEDELFRKLRVKDGYVRILQYKCKLEYLLYGEEVLREMARQGISRDKKKKLIEDIITHFIDDIFYFLEEYGINYIEILPLMHDYGVDRRKYVLEHFPLGRIQEFDEACEYSNMRVSGLSDFDPKHYHIFYGWIDIFIFWLTNKQILFQLILKVKNLAYAAGLEEEVLGELAKFVVYRYDKRAAELFSLENTSQDINRTVYESLTKESSKALELCYRQGIYLLREKIREGRNRNGDSYAKLKGQKWYEKDFGPASGEFPCPSLLGLSSDYTGRLIIKMMKNSSVSIPSLVEGEAYPVSSCGERSRAASSPISEDTPNYLPQCRIPHFSLKLAVCTLHLRQSILGLTSQPISDAIVRRANREFPNIFYDIREYYLYDIVRVLQNSRDTYHNLFSLISLISNQLGVCKELIDFVVLVTDAGIVSNNDNLIENGEVAYPLLIVQNGMHTRRIGMTIFSTYDYEWAFTSLSREECVRFVTNVVLEQISGGLLLNGPSSGKSFPLGRKTVSSPLGKGRTQALTIAAASPLAKPRRAAAGSPVEKNRTVPISVISRIFRLDAYTAVRFSQRADNYFDAEEYKKAILFYKAALFINPWFADASFGLARSYELQDNFKKMKQVYEKFTQAAMPKTAFDYFHLGYAYLQLGDAKEYSEKALNNFAISRKLGFIDEARLYSNIGKAYRRLYL